MVLSLLSALGTQRVILVVCEAVVVVVSVYIYIYKCEDGMGVASLTS